MQNLLVFLATTEPSPGEDLREGLDPEMVTPGTLGFLATLFVVIATVFLIRDMVKRVRRVRYRQQAQSQYDGGESRAPSDRGETDGEARAETDGKAHSETDGKTTQDEADDAAGSAGGGRVGGAASSLERDNGTDPDRKG